MKSIAVIGASYLQLPLVRKARQMGLTVHCFAWAEGAVCKEEADFFYPVSIVDKEAILKVCREVGIDAVVSIASDVAVLTVNYVASKLGLVSNDDRYSAVTTNKYLMRGCFAGAGVPSPRFALCSCGDISSEVASMQYPMIVKPTDRSGSRGVEKVYDRVQLQEAVSRACGESFEHKAIVEEFVSGREISVETISFKGRHHILQITDKVTTGEPFFVELAHHQPTSLPSDICDRVRAVVLNALDALHIEYGASHSELKITPEGDIRVIEVGARMGGDFIGSDLVRLSTGYDFVEAVIKVALGEFEEPVLPLHRCSGVHFLCASTSSLRDVILHKEDYPDIVEAQITDPVLREIECSADRSGYAIYQSDHRIESFEP